MDTLNDFTQKNPNLPQALDLQNNMDKIFKNGIENSKSGSENLLNYQGLSFYLNKQYDEALTTWKDAQKAFPKDVKAGTYIAKAQTTYKKNVYNDVVVLGRGRGKSAFDAGKYDEAVNIWKKIMEFEPNDKEAKEQLAKSQAMLDKKRREALLGDYFDKGLSAFQAGRFEESLAFWENILALDPMNEVANDYVAKIKAKGIVSKKEIPSESGKMSAESGEPLPTPPTYDSNSFQKMMTPTSSISEPASVPPPAPSVPAETVPAVAPPPPPPPEKAPEVAVKPVLTSDEGIALYQKGKYAQAVQSLEELLKTNPEDAKAKEWIEKVKKVQAQKAQEHYDKGLVSYLEGDKDMAVKEWEEALKIYPQHANSKRALSRLKTLK
jgi:tetratricopeptide (TPR) repeat protein